MRGRMYLPEAANQSTLRFIRAASGSAVVYDYLLEGTLRPDGGGIYGAKGAAAFATREGLLVVSDLGPAELTSRDLIGSDGPPDGMIGEYQRIIHLRVP